ncbi:hypothetical protein HNR76_001113 [Pseudoxanthomonas broegbernensis]|nr:hypothetical protein [Pseudoxanthomonas broegbernensis]
MRKPYPACRKRHGTGLLGCRVSAYSSTPCCDAAWSCGDQCGKPRQNPLAQNTRLPRTLATSGWPGCLSITARGCCVAARSGRWRAAHCGGRYPPRRAGRPQPGDASGQFRRRWIRLRFPVRDCPGWRACETNFGHCVAAPAGRATGRGRLRCGSSSLRLRQGRGNVGAGRSSVARQGAAISAVTVPPAARRASRRVPRKPVCRPRFRRGMVPRPFTLPYNQMSLYNVSVRSPHLVSAANFLFPGRRRTRPRNGHEPRMRSE